jgi:hypothetical protein
VQRHGVRLQSGCGAGEEVSHDFQVSRVRRRDQRIHKNANRNYSLFPFATLRAVRYEDLSLSPYDVTQEILQFYGLAFDERVSEFLDTHTKANVGGVSSTFRDSKSAPFHWAKELPYNEVKYIQDSCKEAMKLWGYKDASNASELLMNFNPLLPFPDFDLA